MRVNRETRKILKKAASDTHRTYVDDSNWTNGVALNLLLDLDDFQKALEALPLNETFEDAADFKDNAGSFLRAMALARAALTSDDKV